MKYLFLLLAITLSACTHQATVSCAYVPAATPKNPYPDLTPASECGERIGHDTLKVDSALLKKLQFDENDLAAIRFSDAVFYINRSGKTASTIYFDNGPDYFVEGLARTTQNGKMGFIDTNLEVVIPPTYDFATPFHNGIADVCNGCTKQHIGEHWKMTGGSWGKINLHGEIVSPLTPKTD